MAIIRSTASAECLHGNNSSGVAKVAKHRKTLMKHSWLYIFTKLIASILRAKQFAALQLSYVASDTFNMTICFIWLVSYQVMLTFLMDPLYRKSVAVQLGVVMPDCASKQCVTQ